LHVSEIILLSYSACRKRSYLFDQIGGQGTDHDGIDPALIKKVILDDHMRVAVTRLRIPGNSKIHPEKITLVDFHYSSLM
jgi:hypothetical protein